jgi:putative membrane protein
MKTSTRLIGIGLAVVIGLGLLVAGFLLSRNGWGWFGYGPGMMGDNFGYGMMNGFGFGGIIPMILTMLFWVVIIALGVLLVSGLVSRANNQSPANLPPAESASDILKKRYARGEITKEQFDEMRRDLNT